MPELPEVENTAKYLSAKIKGSFVHSVKVYWERTIHNSTSRSFGNKIAGLQVDSVWRRGKYLIFNLKSPKAQNDLFMLAHLRMSGSFRVGEGTEALRKHDRVRFVLDKERLLFFHDIRKFGRLYLVKDYKQITANLGYEPLDESFTPEILEQGLRLKAPVKALLLRQDLVAGIGNIYADEALWYSGIHPLQPGCTINEIEFNRLHGAIKGVLAEAIANQGTNFGDNVVEYGVHQPKVYGRTGEHCHRCGGGIKKLVITQRSSHFCPKCQKFKKRKIKPGGSF